ncbi:T7SS effector LXG polymorphic toxin [Siminovitchia terrae]|uniref:T7SS effector LXG polymorphic toxin n=1 Tax=Siminovitchia terrae TaxID=1914933 RepID=UPI0028AC838D|nr:T7SS effector LXG polymorphic toxin [Siminovitchia terrae]
MKILGVSQAIAKLDKDIDQLQRRLDFLDLMDVGIERVLNMDGAFTGEGGEAIILNHAELQLPTIRAFRAHITTTIEKIKKMKAYILEFEPSENGVVTEDFWDTQMTRGLDKVEESTEQSKQKVDEYATSVSHIMNLGKLDISQVLNCIDSSRKFASEVVDDLYMLDNDGVDLMADVQASRTELDTIVQKAVEWTNAGGPLLKGVNIQDVRSHFEEMTLHKEAPDVNMGRLDRGDDRSLVQGVVNFLGTDVKTIQNWGLVGVDVARGAATTIMFTTGMLKFVDNGNGTVKLVADKKWTKQKGKYDSKLASKIHELMKHPKGKYIVQRYGYMPSNLPKEIAGLRNLPKVGVGGLLNRASGPTVIYKNGQRFVNYFRRGAGLGNVTNLGKNVYNNFIPTIKSIDVKNSLKNIKPGGGGWQKNLARAGNVLAVGLNFMEAFSDEHKDKSTAQRTGRALAGTALDIGAAYAGATGGAAIGTMIFPGVGTVVGGFVGAAIGGISANTFLGEPVRQVGEKIGAAAEKGWNAAVDAGKAAWKAASDFGNEVKEGAKNILSGGAKALASLFG